MTKQRTLGIIKPDGVSRNLIGEVLARVEKSGLKIVAAKMVAMDQARAEGFYAVHKARPFFGSLVSFMSSGPVLVFAMEGEDAVSAWRKLMGATNPQEADVGTIRRDFAQDIERNTVHGSDSAENASTEIAYFFEAAEILSH
jgi:nucleoside-diphosphate kinase